jgi:GNAT superfamily N-acetyltransferase
VATISVRAARHGDGEGVARIHRENAAYYADLAPDLFRLPDDEGLAGFGEPDDVDEAELRLVAEVDGEVAGYLEARLEPPLETARFQSQTDLGQTRLFINYAGTHRRHWRRGIASRLAEAAEAWGRRHGASVVLCDTWIDSPVSMPFWKDRMGYRPRGVIFRKPL